MADITMPQLGETVTEGTITKWLKAVGEAVTEDDVLFEVSTDKVDSEVPSPVTGFLTEILVPEGETVDVGTRLAVISAGAPAAGDQPPPTEPPAPEPEPDLAAAVDEALPEEPISEAPPPPPPPTPPAAAASGPGKVLSPVVRRLIAEHGLDPAQIEGTGAGGRITRDDVLALIDQQGVPAANGGGTTPAPAPVDQPPLTAGERDTLVPFTNIRRRTAEHMIRSKQTSAHTVVSVEVDFFAVDRIRRPEKLTYLPFVSRAVIDAIAEWPHMNSSVGDDQLIVHRYINLGIAVDLNFEGLLVPVIHEAGDKRLQALAREIASLAERARTKRLTMDDISGGTFTITNAGPFGTLFTIPVINQPQIAILATDSVRKRPVVVELPDGSDAIAVHPVGNLVLSFDHRAVDGAYASAFMRSVKTSLETRDWSAEL